MLFGHTSMEMKFAVLHVDTLAFYWSVATLENAGAIIHH